MNYILPWLTLALVLFILHVLYWKVIVPFHYRHAEKMGCEYDPHRNEYVRKKGNLI